MVKKHKPYERTWVRCKEDETIYESAAEAACAIGVGKAAMYNHLAGRCKTLRGYSFERVPAGTGA